MSTVKPPTSAEVRKAFRFAVDAVGMAPDDRILALEAFNQCLRPDVPVKRTRRQEQNKAIKDVQTLADLMPDLLDQAIYAIKRNDFTSGQRLHTKNELWGPDDNPLTGNNMTGTPPPYTSDPTGEEACWAEMDDSTGKIISEMCRSLGQWRDMAVWLHEQSNIDVRVRAKKTMPDCLACGDQCIERVVSGFDDKCYRRFVRLGRPDRSTFIQMVKNELAMFTNVETTVDVDSSVDVSNVH